MAARKFCVSRSFAATAGKKFASSDNRRRKFCLTDLKKLPAQKSGRSAPQSRQE
jgi:hypothetical protein